MSSDVSTPTSPEVSDSEPPDNQGFSSDSNGKTVVVSVTPFEAKLLQALRSHPDRVAMWVSRGDPMKAPGHKELLAMYFTIFDLLNQHGIEYWLEFGSLLGYVRHRGISPWEWDGDIACTSENFRKIQELGYKVEAEDPVWGFKYYHDPDYKAPGYSFYLKANPDVLCDICEYLDEGDYLANSIPEWNYPKYLKSDVLPPRRVLMMGQATFIPNKGELVLSKVQRILGQCTTDPNNVNYNRVHYMQCDPVPFLLTHLFHPQFAETFCSAPALDIVEVESIQQALATAAREQPFIVRRGNHSIKIASLRELLAHEDTATNAFADKSLHPVTGVSVQSALQQWEAGQLQVHLLDAALSEEFSYKAHGLLALPEAATANLFLTNTNSVAALHQEPATEGGRFLVLAEGTLLINAIDFSKSSLLLKSDAATASAAFADLFLDDLLYSNQHALWGNIKQGWLEAGDFLYLPPAYTHRDYTYQKCLGLTGFISPNPRDQYRLDTLQPTFESRNVNPCSFIGPTSN